MKTVLFTSLFLLILMSPAWTIEARPVHPDDKRVVVSLRAEKYYRTELYFGRSIPGGGMVSDQEWEQFLADTVTPRFPDGFTILKGLGQYREKSGRIVSEPSEVLVFLYSSKNKKESRWKIEEIRAAYVKKFNQESVLRVDTRNSVKVSF